MSNKLGGIWLNGNQLKWIIGTHSNWKNQNPAGRFGATSWTALPIWPIWPIFAVNGLDWKCCLAGSSKTAPMFLIVSIAIGADYSFELIFIETYAPQFIGHKNSFLSGVIVPCFNVQAWMDFINYLPFHKLSFKVIAFSFCQVNN